MKKYFYSLLPFVFSAALFADFTETSTLSDGVEGFDIVGTGSASDLKSTSYNWIRLSGQINFDDDTSITLTSGAQSLGTSGKYSFTTLDTSGAVLNFTGFGTLTITPSNSGINSFNGPLTISVAKGAGGLITPKVCGQNIMLTLNLDQEYGIRSLSGGAFTLTNTNNVYLNMSENQRIISDFRSSTTFHLNITNGATLYIDGASILNHGISAKIMIENDLTDGSILFLKDIVSSGYDSETASLVIISSGKAERLYFIDSDSNAFTGLNWFESSDGNYWVLTAVPEPAHWAAALGAAVLALALFRRRK